MFHPTFCETLKLHKCHKLSLRLCGWTGFLGSNRESRLAKLHQQFQQNILQVWPTSLYTRERIHCYKLKHYIGFSMTKAYTLHTMEARFCRILLGNCSSSSVQYGCDFDEFLKASTGSRRDQQIPFHTHVLFDKYKNRIILRKNKTVANG